MQLKHTMDAACELPTIPHSQAAFDH